MFLYFDIIRGYKVMNTKQTSLSLTHTLYSFLVFIIYNFSLPLPTADNGQKWSDTHIREEEEIGEVERERDVGPIVGFR